MGKLKTLVSKTVHFVDSVISSVAVRSMLLYTGWGDQLPHAHAHLKAAGAGESANELATSGKTRMRQAVNRHGV